MGASRSRPCQETHHASFHRLSSPIETAVCKCRAPQPAHLHDINPNQRSNSGNSADSAHEAAGAAAIDMGDDLDPNLEYSPEELQKQREKNRSAGICGSVPPLPVMSGFYCWIWRFPHISLVSVQECAEEVQAAPEGMLL